MKKRLLVPVLALLLPWFAFPWILGAVGAVATLFGFKLPNLDWPIFLWLIPLLLALAWGTFMGVVGRFTELLRWLQSRPVLRLAEWWLALPEDQRIWKVVKFLIIVGVVAVFI